MSEAGCVRISAEAANCPAALKRYLDGHASTTATARGDLAILQWPTLALFCSVKCPGNLILQTYDLARDLRDAGVTVIGGFHTPMEQECLALLLRGAQPVVICPARAIDQMRLPSVWKDPLATGRLLLLSPFDEQHRRVTANLAGIRNAFVAALADQVFIAYADPCGKTEAFAREVAARGKPVWTLDSAHNDNLLRVGARAVAAKLSDWVLR